MSSTVENVDLVVPPPPYILPDPALSFPSPSLSPTEAEPNDSAHSTPLPSYNSSPILAPILSTLQTLSSTPASLPALKLSASTNATPPRQDESFGGKLLSYTASILIALLGATIVDTLWTLGLNVIGFAFSVLQVPMAVVLASEFDQPHCTTTPSPSTTSTFTELEFTTTTNEKASQGENFPMVGGADKVERKSKGRQERDWIHHLTQLMWDWHDELEVAELWPPSTWV
ncbi:uncharacterized protein UBRO_05806 [Ustilago bromivora]|uniref:Uncharacterized protein n=1 Tax=Ustilago bromivora TaxID=307758 RepID=A0A1K0HIC8_9BASI|nr:uncharacterized protein UBRO_05806 [Ustilago bromivora]SYW77946.1 uncharacterized protein UBRO2_02138 [Ustilago bromivora]